MKCYLIYDAYLGSFYCKHLETDGLRVGGWVNRDSQKICLIDNKEEAQKLFRAMGKLSKSTLQLMEVDIPDEEYKQIVEEMNANNIKLSKITASAHSSEDIKKAIKGEV